MNWDRTVLVIPGYTRQGIFALTLSPFTDISLEHQRCMGGFIPVPVSFKSRFPGS